MFRIIDKYIIRKFLSTFFYLSLLIITLAILFDITEKVDSFVDENVPFSEIVLDYYIYFAAWIWLLQAPLFVFLSVIYFTSRMARNLELVTMVAGNISIQRIIRPYLFSATVLMLIFLLFQHFLLPYTVRERNRFEEKYWIAFYTSSERNIHFQTKKNEFVYLHDFDQDDSTAVFLTIEKIKNKSVEYKLSADSIRWNRQKQIWTLVNWSERFVSTAADDSICYGTEREMVLPFTPAYFNKDPVVKEMMSTPKLNRHIGELEAMGDAALDTYYLEKYRRSAVPFGTIILTLLGFMVSYRTGRRGMSVNIVTGLILCAAYILSQQFSAAFSTHADLSPLVAGWTPNIVFGIAALLIWYRQMTKA